MTGPVRPLALGLVLLAAALAGCGYSFRGNLPDHIQTVAIPVFANKTGEPAVENFLTSAVVEAFSTNGRLRVVPREDADAILEGEGQYRLVVTMNLRFRDVRRNTVLFEEQRLREKADFRVLNAVSQTISREESAVRSAAIDIARAIVSLTVNRF